MSEGSLTPSMARFASAHVFVVRGGGVGGGGGAKGLGRGITIVDFFGGAAGTPVSYTHLTLPTKA